MNEKVIYEFQLKKADGFAKPVLLYSLKIRGALMKEDTDLFLTTINSEL